MLVLRGARVRWRWLCGAAGLSWHAQSLCVQRLRSYVGDKLECVSAFARGGEVRGKDGWI